MKARVERLRMQIPDATDDTRLVLWAELSYWLSELQRTSATVKSTLRFYPRVSNTVEERRMWPHDIFMYDVYQRQSMGPGEELLGRIMSQDHKICFVPDVKGYKLETIQEIVRFMEGIERG